ncbi:hypothetical protein [Vitiosangium sp. GDMCC 1.1324]|uniref:hypothetical protein n=1 Tax=Vitiosangium sp. (strain GDMCC 1.1324) TaxID=2138576 RepID=UPI000D337FF5|nr:hypothetical protein [Vitiosangium sp. GDMCC 1.1324]PTL82962.1 hypothetical protein DAT35_13120 [Vitiosangium sp. GDMCC 1.1324]
MAAEDRALRDTLERLQTELREVKDDLARNRAEVARLEQLSSQEKQERTRMETALADANSRAREADAAFQRALHHLNRAREQRKLAPLDSTSLAREPLEFPDKGGFWLYRLDAKIRFGKGAFIGTVIGLGLARARGLSFLASAGLVVGSALVMGLLVWWLDDFL